MIKKILIKVIIVISIFNCGTSCYAHPGRLDSNGGHWNRSTGEYHYHNGNSEEYYEEDEELIEQKVIKERKTYFNKGLDKIPPSNKPNSSYISNENIQYNDTKEMREAILATENEKRESKTKEELDLIKNSEEVNANKESNWSDYIGRCLGLVLFGYIVRLVLKNK